MSTRKVRYKKLNTKTPLPVLREDQIDPSEYESLTTESQIATGVEQAEENEYHLQAALRGVGASTDNEIPVPPPQKSEISYDELYPNPYVEPRNYIKFSETVEETLSSLYDMTLEDEEYLKSYNGKRTGGIPLSEDDFERIMEVFEDTAAEQAPFAAVDNTVVPYEIMVQTMTHLISNKLIDAHAKNVYEYWKTRRQACGNRRVHPSLKFETHQEHDDMDPYVCFRRREVRQTRKTRARDAQVSDKLKKLRRELEDARQLVVFSQQRELSKREVLNGERVIFEQRAGLKETKVRLAIKSDDEDLYNARPQKRPRTEAQQPARTGPHGSQLRLIVRPDGGRTVEPADLAILSDKLAEKENELRNDVEAKVQNHRRWNNNYVDITAEPLSPVDEEMVQSFRPAKTTYLMTPPASASASDPMDIDGAPPTDDNGSLPLATIRDISSIDPLQSDMMSAYRRRIGRLNRLFIDRRPPKPDGRSPPREMDDLQSDRWKYDQDDDDDEQPVYEIDPNSSRQMKFRSTIPPSPYLFRGRGMEPLALQASAPRQALPQAQTQTPNHHQHGPPRTLNGAAASP